MRRIVAFFAATLCALPVVAGAGADDVSALRAAGRMSDAAAIVDVPPLDPLDPRWRRAPATMLKLYPQSAVPPESTGSPPLTAEVRMLAGATSLAVRLEWPDASADSWRTDRTDAFADALAVQFATAGDGLPYIGMGEPGRPVRIWMWRAGRGAERLTAEGFGSLATAAGAPLALGDVRTERGWAVVLRGERPVSANPLAFAVAVWDGGAAERAGAKRLSAWHLFALPGAALDAAWLKRLRAEAAVGGDPARGRTLIDAHGCAACHRLPGGAPTDLAPDLTNAGALHWPGYLLRSIREPSAFVVPRAAYRADDPATSLMPKPDADERALADLAAYLATLRD